MIPKNLSYTTLIVWGINSIANVIYLTFYNPSIWNILSVFIVIIPTLIIPIFPKSKATKWLLKHGE
jgi:hypothetical protein